MDGYRTASALGILYAEDFGHGPQTMPPPAATVADPPPLTQSDIDTACIDAISKARLAWAASDAVRHSEALDNIRSAICSLHHQVTEQIEAIADGIARTALSAIASALPSLCHAHGDAEVQALLCHILPLLARRTQVVVSLHAGLLDAVQAEIAAFDETLSEHIALRAADLPPGDVRLHWDDGNLVRNGSTIRAAIHDALRELGLLTLDPESETAATPRRSTLDQ